LALFQSARSALVSVRFVDDASTFIFSFANVLAVSSDRPFEETGAAVTSEDVVVFSRGKVTAYLARNVEDST
jgi:hypothetical protein